MTRVADFGAQSQAARRDQEFTADPCQSGRSVREARRQGDGREGARRRIDDQAVGFVPRLRHSSANLRQPDSMDASLVEP